MTGGPAARFEAAVAVFDGDPRVSSGTGFGGAPGRRVDGRIFAMSFRDQLVVKLPASRVTELVQVGEATWFDAGKGRPMREWASVDAGSAVARETLVAEAFGFVGGRAS